MDQEKQHDIALMRYSVISPVISGLPETYSSLEAFYRDASKKGTIAPDGTLKHFAPATIERWYRNYRRGGFDALIPQGRVDEGKPRKLDDDLQEQIRWLKENYPRMSASAIFRQLQDNGSIKSGEISESIINRYVNQLAVQLKTTTNPDMRRYERPHINEVWCGDSSVGPYLKTDDGKKHRVYIIALIDIKQQNNEEQEKNTKLRSNNASISYQIATQEQRHSRNLDVIAADEDRLETVRSSINAAETEYAKYADMITDKKNNLELLSSKESELIERTKIAESVFDMFRQSGTDDVREKLIDVMYENQKLREENTTLKELLEKAYEFMKQFVIDGVNLLERFLESVGKVVGNVYKKTK